ncbi:heat shock protein, putative [Plasmodium chabaudi adami]|uniref:Heat shock protein, putative n=1 Tax=Plasmodium chabaudi adami TaxID=5826 RepID=A0A1D3LEM3_PLACE|nr:heat shock protein, putative [Plasmodium chabaudi adami]
MENNKYQKDHPHNGFIPYAKLLLFFYIIYIQKYTESIINEKPTYENVLGSVSDLRPQRILTEHMRGKTRTMQKLHTEDYYNILGVTKGADLDQITKAYKKLAVKWHPDKHRDDDDSRIYAEEMFKNISSAYSVLSDEKQRKIYDTYGVEGIKGTMEAPKSFDHTEYLNKIINPLKNFSFKSMINEKYTGLSNLLHHAESKSHPFSEIGKVNHNKAGSREITLELTLEELYQGCKKEYTIVKNVYVGVTHFQVDKTLVIDIKPGFDDNTLIVFHREGDQVSPSSPPGNITFRITTKKHDTLTRRGNNLVYKQYITLEQALKGFDFSVKSLDNKDIIINVDNVVSPNSKMVIPNEGMPYLDNPNHKGDLIIEFVHIYPESMTEEEKMALRDIINSKNNKHTYH